MTKGKKGVIYILTNPSFPAFVKIGYAEDILTIAHELGHAVDDFVHYEASDSTDVSAPEMSLTSELNMSVPWCIILPFLTH